MRRRDFLVWTGAALACSACSDLSWAGGGEAGPFQPGRKDAVKLTDAKWKEVLEPREYRILRQAGTERAFTGDLWDNKRDGVYVCAGCALPLYDAKTKFRSGTGWPSFYKAIGDDHVAERADRSLGMTRTEVLCNRCGGHLGHVFPDGPPPTGMRHCINSFALDFVPRDQVGKLGPVALGGWDPDAPPAGTQAPTDASRNAADETPDPGAQ